MGFFKKLGSTVKKATKQISFKNAVKLAGTALSSVPGIGGIAGSAVLSAQDAHYAKKAEKQAQNEYQAQQANEAYQNAQANLNNSAHQIGKTIGGHVLQNGYNGLNEGVKTGASSVGAEIMQGSIIQWLKKRWYVPVGLLAAIFLVVRLGGKRSTSRRR